MRRAELAANLIMSFGPLVAALAIAAVLTIRSEPLASAWACLALWAAGLMLLFVAKLSLFRRGVWISWGPGRMPSSLRRVYFAGYALIAAGAAVCLILIL